MLVQTLQGTEAPVAKVEALVPGAVLGPVGRLVLVLALPADELLGNGALGIVGTHKRKERATVHFGSFAAGAGLDVVGDARGGGVGLAAEETWGTVVVMDAGSEVLSPRGLSATGGQVGT